MRTNPANPNAEATSAPNPFTIRLATPATGLTVGVSLGSPQVTGTTILVTAEGSGSTTGGLPTPPSGYDYQFMVNYNNTGYVFTQTYGNGATWAWTPTLPGTYYIAVWARTSNSVTLDVANIPITYVIQIP